MYKVTKNIPKSVPIKNRKNTNGSIHGWTNSYKNNENEFIDIQNYKAKIKRLRFCALQIFHCNINHFQSLKELKKLKFEIPQTEFTSFVSDIEIYLQCWKEGKLFKNYPTSGIVLKINSRKLQKSLGENNLAIHWAYAINQWFFLKPEKYHKSWEG